MSKQVPRYTLISIHSLRMEGDISVAAISRCNAAFQSTPSAWRETDAVTQTAKAVRISIHSLRMEGDLIEGVYLRTDAEFQSTPSAWRETFCQSLRSAVHTFQSTPSAWRETRQRFQVPVCYCNFNPLPPHGGRLYKKYAKAQRYIFQSTPSAWRETSRD